MSWGGSRELSYVLEDEDGDARCSQDAGRNIKLGIESAQIVSSLGLVPDRGRPGSFLNRVGHGWLRTRRRSLIGRRLEALQATPATTRILENTGVVECTALSVEVRVGPHGAK